MYRTSGKRTNGRPSEMKWVPNVSAINSQNLSLLLRNIFIIKLDGLRPLSPSAFNLPNPPVVLANNKNLTAFYMKYFSYLSQQN